MRILVLGVAIVVGGCAADSAVRPAPDYQARPASTNPVCFLRTPLPANIKHRVLGDVTASKEFYGSVSELMPGMADDARKLGADAVINFSGSQRIGLWAWARPVGQGTAVKLERPSELNCAALGGELR